MGLLSKMKKLVYRNKPDAPKAAVSGYWMYLVKKPVPGAVKWDADTIVSKQIGESRKIPSVGFKDGEYYRWQFVDKSIGDVAIPFEHRLVDGRLVGASIPAYSGRAFLVDLIIDKDLKRKL